MGKCERDGTVARCTSCYMCDWVLFGARAADYWQETKALERPASLQDELGGGMYLEVEDRISG